MFFKKWRLKLFLLYLLFYFTFSAPLGKRPGSVDESHGGKKGRQDEANPDYEECYFKTLRKTELEKRPRSEITTVDEECAENLISFTELIANTDDKYTKLGAPNEAAIVLARGAGEFPDFDDENVVDEISRRKICPVHRNELSINWETSKHVKTKRRKAACSVPPTLPYNLNHPVLVDAVVGVVNYLAAKAVLFVNETLIHVGSSRCQVHREMIKASITIFNKNTLPVTDTSVENVRGDQQCETTLPERKAKINAPCYKEDSPEKDIQVVSETVKNTFFAFLKEMKLPQKTAQKKWQHLKRTSRYHYISVLNKVYDTASFILGGKDNHEQLKAAAVAALQPKNVIKAQNNAQDELLQELKLRFYRADSTYERRNYLSLFVEVLPFKVIENVIPDITEYQYYEAKKMARRNKSHQQKPERGYKETVKKTAVEKFVQFFSSEIFSIGIPFGRIRKRLSNKKIVDLPVTVREMRDSKIIKKYKTFLAETGQTAGMSDTTLRKILKACPAKRKISFRAVDEQKADGILAFEWILEIVIDLENKNLISKDEADDYKNRLTEAEFFLRTDYYMLLTYDHHSADFCITYALSDARQSEYRVPNHLKKDHLYRTSRAHIFKDLIKELKEVVDGIEAEDEERKLDQANYKITIEEAEYAVDKWQSHIVRARFSDDRRAVLSELQNGEAFVTLDFAQKWQPHYFREKQSMYYGKAGNCFSVLHALFKQSGALVQHTVAHFLGYCDQDYVTVTAILLDAFKLLADKGVKRLKLRSDNAAYYHNPALILSMPGIGKTTGLVIERYSFSEAQTGKGICDVMASLFKTALLDYGHQGNDVATADQMFDGINDAIRNGYLDGITAVKATVVPKKTDKANLVIPDLLYVGEFEYGVDADKNDNVKIWKHFNIGEGKIMNLPEAAKQLPLQQLEGVTKTEPTPLFWREKTLMIKNPKEKKEKEVKATLPPPINEDDIEPLYQCEVQGCRKEYLTLEPYEKHKLFGKHDFAPIKETIDEKAHQLFYDHVTGIKNKHNLFVENTMSAADVEMDISEVLPEGWALKKPPRRTKYTTEIQEFLNNEYVNYVKSGRKRYDPYHIQQKMRKSRKPMFKAEERLSASKINSYFNTRKKKLEALANTQISIQEEERIRKETNEAFAQNLENDDFVMHQMEEEEEEEVTVFNEIVKKAKKTNEPDTIYFEDEDEENEDSETGETEEDD
uniref:C2H2-type domain-containing protein n=1 Tax=Panagrolaimus davidi TaxID=227884 RepID=A0A914Q5W9_9BILA